MSFLLLLSPAPFACPIVQFRNPRPVFLLYDVIAFGRVLAAKDVNAFHKNIREHMKLPFDQ
jgi:hypothetical protein